MADINLSSYAEILVPQNILDVNYVVSCIERYLDMVSTANIVYSNNLQSSVITRVSDKSQINSTVSVNHFIDLYNRVYVPFSKQLDSSAKITEQNALDVIFSLSQAPVYTLTNAVIQDAYIRQARPTLNYGKSQSFIVGNAVDGKYRTFIQFDITPYINLSQAFILTGEVILNLSGSYDSNQIIDAYRVYTNWNENNITWASSQNYSISSVPLFSFNCKTSQVRINILDYLNYMKSNNITVLNIELKARNESAVNLFNFASKESSIISYRPRIEIKYQDLIWNGVTEKIELNSSASITAKRHKDMFSYGIVKGLEDATLNSSALIGIWEDTDLNSNIIVSTPDNIENNGYADIWNKILLDSSAVVTSEGNPIELDGDADIWNKILLDSQASVLPNINLNSSVDIIRGVDNNSSADIYLKKDLSGEAIVRLTDFINLNSNSVITVYEELDGYVQIWKNLNLSGYANIRVSDSIQTDGYAFVRDSNDIQSSATVRVTKTLDLNPSSVISRLGGNINNDGTANILFRLDNESSATVRVTKTIDLDPSSVVTRLKNSEELSGQTNIRENINLNSIANIYPTKNLDSNTTVALNVNINGTVSVVPTVNINCNVFVNQKIDLQATAEINKTLISLESSSIIRPQIQIISDVDIRNHINLPSEALIQHTQVMDNIGSAIIRRLDKIDNTGSSEILPNIQLLSSVMAGIWIQEIDSSAIVRKSQVIDNNGSAIIWHNKTLDSQVNIFRILDLSGQTNISSNKTIDSISQITKNTQLSSSSIIRRTEDLDLLSEAIIRQFDINEIDSLVYIEGWFSKSLESIALIRRSDRDNLPSNVLVQTTSRKWIPNIHGGDVFIYDDRKLPRKWSRSQFIP